MTTACLLALLLCSQPTSARALTVAHFGVAVADTYSTQRNYDLCRVFAGCNPGRMEANPVAKPFQSVGRPVAYAATYWYSVGTSYLAYRMRTSRNWTRKIWWIPQVVGIGAHAWAVNRNVGLYYRAIAACGLGCRNALR